MLVGGLERADIARHGEAAGNQGTDGGVGGGYTGDHAHTDDLVQEHLYVQRHLATTHKQDMFIY